MAEVDGIVDGLADAFASLHTMAAVGRTRAASAMVADRVDSSGTAVGPWCGLLPRMAVLLA